VLLTGGAALWIAGTTTMAVVMSGSPSTVRWLGAIVVIGAGSGFLWGPLMATSLSNLPVDSMADGMGLSQTVQNIGSALGVALAVTILGKVDAGQRGAFPGLWVASAATTFVGAGLCAFVASARPSRSASTSERALVAPDSTSQ
jgi:hypothetical protein